ncbi:MAG: hypothetical protein IRZ16_14015 [Myxococcaceae bacterium]|nr:hypothetical protein [Myxococcaceae bacterium]
MRTPSALWCHREPLARLTGNPVAEVEALLELIEDRSCWMLGPVDGAWVIRLVPGPARPGARLTLFRLDPEAALPAPKALEECLVLSGRLCDDHGGQFEPGERLQREPGDKALFAGREAECVCCVVIPGEEERRAFS